MGVRNVALLSLALLLAGCAAAGPSPAASPLSPLSPLPAPGPLALTVVHSNDTWGYLDPCG